MEMWVDEIIFCGYNIVVVKGRQKESVTGMEARIDYTSEELARMEIRQFVNQGLEDICDNALLDFDSTFDEIERRYSDEQ